jgi:hypothetical protein
VPLGLLGLVGGIVRERDSPLRRSGLLRTDRLYPAKNRLEDALHG